jgi:hypothetical protein
VRICWATEYTGSPYDWELELCSGAPRYVGRSHISGFSEDAHHILWKVLAFREWHEDDWDFIFHSPFRLPFCIFSYRAHKKKQQSERERIPTRDTKQLTTSKILMCVYCHTTLSSHTHALCNVCWSTRSSSGYFLNINCPDIRKLFPISHMHLILLTMYKRKVIPITGRGGS